MNLFWWINFVMYPFVIFWGVWFSLMVIAGTGIVIKYIFDGSAITHWRNNFERLPLWKRWLTYWVIGLVIYVVVDYVGTGNFELNF